MAKVKEIKEELKAFQFDIRTELEIMKDEYPCIFCHRYKK